MFNFVKSELEKLNIELVSCLRLDECNLKRPYLLERKGIERGSVIIFAVPYLTAVSAGERNISSYAVSRDYHIFFASLFEQLIPTLEKRYPQNKFAGFTDHSPIDEIKAGALAGLGIIGENHLLITEKYSSYIFIGEIITDATLPSLASEVKRCEGCKKCIEACPVKMNADLCLSALTQKKGELNEGEKLLISQSACAWGCDLCQEACPHTKAVLDRKTACTEIDFFKDSLIPHLESNQVEQMSDDEFASRAYSWRGKNTIKRNLKILEGKEK